MAKLCLALGLIHPAATSLAGANVVAEGALSLATVSKVPVVFVTGVQDVDETVTLRSNSTLKLIAKVTMWVISPSVDEHQTVIKWLDTHNFQFHTSQQREQSSDL